MSAFDEIYGDGSLEQLADELTVGVLGTPEVEAFGDGDPDWLMIRWANSSHVQLAYVEDAWRYLLFSLTPPRQGIYRELSLAFCRAAIERGVSRFEAAPNRDASAALRASGWDFDEDGLATVTPEHLAEYGERFE